MFVYAYVCVSVAEAKMCCCVNPGVVLAFELELACFLSFTVLLFFVIGLSVAISPLLLLQLPTDGSRVRT